MGVLGLKSYIEKNKEALKIYHFKNSKLIIDGSSLYHSLYFNFHLDQVHGGEYESFEKLVNRFFTNLKVCNIQPYVVLDGGNDTTMKKSDTLLTRAEDRIKRAHALSTGHSGEVLPILTNCVFKQVLHKLKVPFVQCLAEADWEVAALANDWKCPVLSNDSDFYIFNISAGFLPISHFQWKEVPESGKKFITAKLFNVKNLCALFNCLNKDLLPLFATILGNDYTKLDKGLFPDFSTCARSSVATRSAVRINGLLMWLSHFPDQKAAIKTLVGMVNTEHSTTVRITLDQGVKEYRLRASSIARFFTTGDIQPSIQGPLQNLPGWMLKPLAEGKLNAIIINTLTLQQVRLTFPVENSQLPSSNQTSRPIRQVVYGLLLGTGGPGCYEVEEYDRQDLKLTSSRVPAILPRCAATHLHLDTLWEAPRHLHLQVLLDTLQVSQQPDSLCVPVNLQLAAYVTCYWLKHAQPEPKAELYWALLVGLVYGELSREPKRAKGIDTSVMALTNHKQDESDKKLARTHHLFTVVSCLFFWLHRLYNGPLVHEAARRMKSNNNPESLLADAPYPLKLFRQLRAAVERELGDDLARKMRMGTGAGHARELLSTNKDSDLSRMFEQLMHEEEDSDDQSEGKAGNHDQIYKYTYNIRTRHKKKSRTCARDPKSKKHDRVCFD
uniref:XPG N-terminal domain-containing protein n=1 Tax=Electrophorus electricus TaxID=8005 RepID=A0A4W4F798_ELEEL